MKGGVPVVVGEQMSPFSKTDLFTEKFQAGDVEKQKPKTKEVMSGFDLSNLFSGNTKMSKLVDKQDSVCMTCRGQGTPGGCPACGKNSIAASVVVDRLSDEMLEDLSIPAQYKNIEWNPELLIANHPKLRGSEDFKMYVSILTKCIKQCKEGLIPKKSMLLVAPSGMGKRTFAYCVMKECIRHGFSTCQIVDTTQYRRLNILSSERPFSQAVTEFPVTIEKLHSVDVLFVTVDQLSIGNSLRVVAQICDRRARQGKPTIILSRYAPGRMKAFDRDFDESSFINYRDKFDVQRYPSLLMIGREVE